MILRVVAGQGTALAFILVAFGFLGATMVGWRLLGIGPRPGSRRRSGLVTGSDQVVVAEAFSWVGMTWSVGTG